MCACAVDIPCWKLIFDTKSALHSALADRGLGLHIGAPSAGRHLLKVYSRGTFLARHKNNLYTFPNLDVFMSATIRCNVSDLLDSSGYARLSADRDKKRFEQTEEREKQSKELQIYETDIWVYRSYPDRFRHGCNVLDQSFSHQMVSEIYPQQRYKFGPIELWGPNRTDAVLIRGVGRNWRTHLHRWSESHMSDVVGDARAGELEALRVSQPFQACHLDTTKMEKEGRAWVARMATPITVVRDEDRKDKKERRRIDIKTD